VAQKLRFALIACGLAVTLDAARAEDLTWIQTARVFLVDAYQPPFAPHLEYDANALAKTMAEMHANTIRIGTMGKYATIQGVRFSTSPELGKRDLLAETIAAVKPLGIRVVPYISTGHKLAWSMVTRDYPEYGQRTRPGGGPSRDHMYVGEDHGTVCWNTPYRQAFLDLVEHVVRDYDVDGLYFDAWQPYYFWPEPKVCYCDGCRDGFRKASGGKELPWHENPADFTEEERKTIDEYHHWYEEQLMGVLLETRRIVKAHKDIPLICNVGNPRNIHNMDPRVLQSMDAFLYERGHSLLERAEGVSLARAAGLGVWPYVGVYNNWPRIVPNGLDYQQEIFATVAFGGAPIVAQTYGYVTDTENRRWVSDPFSVLKDHERDFSGFENVPYAAVVYSYGDPPDHAQKGMFWPVDIRSSTLGAFAACLYGHLQVSSVPEQILDEPERLGRYRVLYLADVSHLSAGRVANIEHFVAAGGGLVASYTASLYGPKGERLERFDLEDLLRVRPARLEGELADIVASYRCMIGGPNDLYLVPAGEAASQEAHSRLVPLWYFEPVEALSGGTVETNIVMGYGRRPILPGVVASRHGKGRVIYLASNLESLYGSTRQADLGNLIRGLVEAAAGTPPPYRVEAPPTLVSNLTQNGNRRVLHLLNWTGDTENEANYLPPAENVTVRMTLPDGLRVRSVSVFPDATARPDAGPRIGAQPSPRWEVSGRELELVLPQVDAYRAVSVDLE
jgi:hypothetical protein